MPKPDLLPTSAVAQRLGVHVRTIHRWVNEGVLIPVVRTPGIRGAYLFDRADVERLAKVRAA